MTFAVVGHNEATTLSVALGYAREAAGSGDSVWFVDSASSDGSADIARSHDVEVVAAPRGKGRAMAVALARCRDDFICFFDGDFGSAEQNIPRRLRDAVIGTDVDMLIGRYREPGRRQSVTPAIYRPLVGALFPEVLDEDIEVPLSGFRVLRLGTGFGALPHGYGVETHLNIHLALAGRRIASCDVGWFRGDLRGYTNIPAIAADVAAAILDLAEDRQRLDPRMRPEWETWVDEAVELFRNQPPPGAEDSQYLHELARVAARPLPDPR